MFKGALGEEKKLVWDADAHGSVTADLDRKSVFSTISELNGLKVIRVEDSHIEFCEKVKKQKGDCDLERWYGSLNRVSGALDLYNHLDETHSQLIKLQCKPATQLF
jgi:hypothetical protein